MIVEDIPQVKQVAIDSWYATYENIIPLDVQNIFLENAYSEERLLTRLSKSPFYVAKLENKVVGFANFSNMNVDGKVELAAIYLNKNFQHQGVGSKLLQFGIDQLRPTQILLNVEAENKIRRQFYEAKGFKIIDQFDEVFEGHILNTIRMALDL